MKNSVMHYSYIMPETKLLCPVSILAVTGFRFF